ncbi:hypothetical protein [Pseudomonas syringae]|uniref:Uncharacterized protein n=2 Tax=Pseudomonas syringae TaxID=317 RepID=A0A6B2B155_PSESX|nr:hypothetical protein [Pseudomonas syringae]AKF49161.1 hypothetical protein PsyrH_01565 [Pseudomonas syringae pv. syringae HS191]AVX25139.1 hypothetical protein DA456_17965 [Pseudomonas syringae pv. atrofaciens]KPW12835.1 Uncharacterized protein ALO42_00598 [Pseudomonas syringae pv. atrofaciens]MBI6562325.1 hypothetical protein [Pseudomonas syringae]MBI6569747.1 hypothetical protein [Pseudomonas syringae]
MEELHHHLRQLPGFLQAELAAQVGDWSGIRYIDITDKHVHAINHLIAIKRAPLRQDHIDNSYFLWGADPWDKSSLELNAQMRATPGGLPTDFYYMTVDARFHIESIRFLNELKGNLESLHARLIEQEREYNERMAQEAAQRQAEEEARARAEAEEAARRLAEEQAAQQRAIEAAFQLAQRQVEEAEHALALRNAEEARAKEAESNRAIEMTFGPEASREIDNAIKVLRGTIEIAITDFSNTISAHGALDMSQLEAIQNMSTVH